MPWNPKGQHGKMIPPEADVFARIKADHRNRRGPFAYAVVMAFELVAHYDVRSIKITQATWALRHLGLREVIVMVTPRSRLFIVDPSLAELQPAEARSLFHQERGLTASNLKGTTS